MDHFFGLPGVADFYGFMSYAISRCDASVTSQLGISTPLHFTVVFKVNGMTTLKIAPGEGLEPTPRQVNSLLPYHWATQECNYHTNDQPISGAGFEPAISWFRAR